MAQKEVNRIDKDVGLHDQMPNAIFKSHTLEWSTTAGMNREKKLPEHYCYWNADLLVEVAAEIDLLYHRVFLEKLNSNAVTHLIVVHLASPTNPESLCCLVAIMDRVPVSAA